PRQRQNDDQRHREAADEVDARTGPTPAAFRPAPPVPAGGCYEGRLPGGGSQARIGAGRGRLSLSGGTDGTGGASVDAIRVLYRRASLQGLVLLHQGIAV